MTSTSVGIQQSPLLDAYAPRNVPVQAPGPAIWTGGSSPDVMRHAARRVDGSLPIRSSHEESVALYDLHGQVLEQWRPTDAPDRQMLRAIYVRVCLADDTDRAARPVRTESSARHALDVAPFVAGVDAALGTAEQSHNSLSGFDASGFDHPLIDLACPDVEKLEQLEALSADHAVSPWLGATLSTQVET